MITSKLKTSVLLLFSLFSILCVNGKTEKEKGAPRIINIINFIRYNDHRIGDSERLLFEATQEQIKLVNKYDFPATFLFQYDALIAPEYQKLMKNLNAKSEIGAWWEITQPHVEAAGIEWRGKHSWVSTANIAFTTGYTPQEREKLVDVYMAKFKELYGKYPKSVGSWYIDSHSLAYMYDKYGIVASCNCKDQVGTDGYTLWGGYWNQAYYPSRKNAYMPAQTKKEQIPVPIFRMLGSDPIYQYDTGVGTQSQDVISLEPVYTTAGKDKKWVEYFLQSMVDEPCLAFSYAQAGQENSFTWKSMQRGLEMQFPILDSLANENKITIQTLGASGEWFKNEFPLTPATAVTALTDVRDEGNKTVWYDSRYYRCNLFWQQDGFCFRDIHLFNENFASDYLNKPGTGGQFYYYTLPLIDRYFWSTPEDVIGLKVVQLGKDGSKNPINLKNPIVTEPSKSILKIECEDEKGNAYLITLKEDNIDVSCKAKETDFAWALELRVPESRLERLPFQSFTEKEIKANFRNFDYSINCKKGTIKEGNKTSGYVFRILPDKNKIVIDCKTKL